MDLKENNWSFMSLVFTDQGNQAPCSTDRQVDDLLHQQGWIQTQDTAYFTHLRPLNNWDNPKFVILHSTCLHSNCSVALYKPNRVRESMWSVSLKLPCSPKTLWILPCVCVFMSACTYVCLYMCMWPIMSLWRGHLAVDSQSLPGAAV